MADDTGFLGRWSRRKTDVREGQVLAEPTQPAAPAVPAPRPAANLVAAAEPAPQQPEPAPLTLEDARLLTPEADFTPFMARNVAPDVKNAAMKKLFTDPHYNIMDGLDTYIDDYSKPDPIPESMLRQMVSAKFLKLFDEEDQKEGTVGDDADKPAPQSVAQSYAQPDIPGSDQTTPESSSPPEALPPPDAQASQTQDADTDLRLQPDHAAGRPGSGRST
ncbi:MAG: DUF3306 domain-containing protein [Pseudomonadota bacterium]